MNKWYTIMFAISFVVWVCFVVKVIKTVSEDEFEKKRKESEDSNINT